MFDKKIKIKRALKLDQTRLEKCFDMRQIVYNSNDENKDENPQLSYKRKKKKLQCFVLKLLVKSLNFMTMCF